MNKELIFLILLAFIFFSFLYLFPVMYWLMARSSGVKISLSRLFIMRIKRVSVKKIINALILAKKGELNIDHTILEKHHLKGGDVTNVVMGLIAANTAKICLSVNEALQQDQNGINVYEEIKKMAQKIGR